MPKLTIPHKLEPFLTKPKRFKIAYGGRGGAKSQTFADILLMLAQTQQEKIGCFREMQNSIEDSVYSLLNHEIARMKLQGFNIEKQGISHQDGGEFRFKGLSRNPDAIKSMHGFTRFWVEEAHSISQESLEKLTPTLREDGEDFERVFGAGSEIWFSMNLQNSQDPMSKRFILPYQNELERHGYYEDDLHLIVKINYQDNPWFPKVLEQERQEDYKRLSRAKYDHIWLGHFNDAVDNAIIEPEWFDAAIDAHVKLGFKPRGARVVSHDPSDLGGDPKGLVYRQGVVILEAKEIIEGDVNDGCDEALDFARDKNADGFVWDADGLGVSLNRQVVNSLDGTKCKAQKYKGSNSPDRPKEYYQNPEKPGDKPDTNEHIFKNKRAQYWWLLRDRFYATYRAVEHKDYIDPDELISISSQCRDIQKLRSEVCSAPRKYNGAGLIQIMTKAEMRQNKIQSPNLGDALKQSFAFIPPERKKAFNRPLEINTGYVV